MKYKFDTTPEKSKQMAKVHSKNGKDEVILRKLLWHYGVRYRANYKKLPGKPDIAITKYINEHYADKIKLVDIARQVNLSKEYLAKFFKKSYEIDNRYLYK